MPVLRASALRRPPRHEARFDYGPGAASELDAALKPALSVSPKYRAQLSAAGVAGKVVVDFFIDESGNVRFPVVCASTSFAFEPPPER